MVFKILLVDDEELVRKSVRRELRSLPVEIIEAADGRQASLHLQEGFDLLITDNDMPGLTGLQLINLAKEFFPRIILYSGRLNDEDAPGGVIFIPKPWFAKDENGNEINLLKRQVEQFLKAVL